MARARSRPSLAGVPEPSTACLAPVAALGGLAYRRRRVFAKAAAAFVIVTAFGSDRAQRESAAVDRRLRGRPARRQPRRGPVGAWPSGTATGPTGWIVDDTGVPGVGNPANDGITDWAGWAFVDKEFWVEADDQDRSLFHRGVGTVMVADPDEWQDGHVEPRFELYDAFVKTPVITIPPNVPAGKIKFAFDSSWRPEGMDEGHAGSARPITRRRRSRCPTTADR